MFDEVFLKAVACPWCVTRPEAGKATLAKAALTLEGPPAAPTGFKCAECGRFYKIENGIPNLVAEDALIASAPAADKSKK